MVIRMSLVGLVYGRWGNGAVGIFPTAVPIRELADVQPRRHLRRLAGAVCGTYLATNYGLQWVGYYLSAAAVLSLAGLAAMRGQNEEL
jgi:hypothetical protein